MRTAQKNRKEKKGKNISIPEQAKGGTNKTKNHRY